MFSLRVFLSACFLLGLLSSCSYYQFMTVSSPSLQTQKNGLVMENDTLVLRYVLQSNPYSPNTMVIYIQNKLSTPFSIDWSQSALIVNGKKVDVSQNVSQFQGNSESVLYQPRPTDPSVINGYTTSGVSGQIIHSQSLLFIPPHSSVQSLPIPIQVPAYHRAKPSEVLPYLTVPATAEGGLQKKIYVKKFTEENTILTFRSYLTFYTTTQPAQAFVVDHPFWISEMIETRYTNFFGTLPSTSTLPIDKGVYNKWLVQKPFTPPVQTKPVTFGYSRSK